MTTQEAPSALNSSEPSLDRLSPLPPELLHSIVDFMAGDDDSRYTRKEDLRNLSATCQRLHDIVQPKMFENVALVFNLDSIFPAPDGSSLQWRQPKLLELIAGRPQLAGLIKNVQLCIEPFPVRSTLTQTEIRRIVSAGSQAMVTYKEGSRTRFPYRPPRSYAALNSQAAGDMAAISTYALMFERVIQEHAYARGRVREGPRPFAEDLAAIVTLALTALPKLLHVEPGSWKASITGHLSDPAVDVLRAVSLAYAQTLVLTTLPAQIVGIEVRSIAAVDRYPLLTEAYNPYGTSSTYLKAGRFVGPPLNQMHVLLPALSNQLTTLRIDISGLQSFVNRVTPYKHVTRPIEALSYWRSILSRMTGLQVLGLTVLEDREWRPAPIPYLETLLTGLAMPSVMRLELKGWAVTTPLVTQRVKNSFKSLSHLRIEDCVIKSDMEQAWIDTATELVRDGVAVELERLSWCRARTKSPKPVSAELLAELQKCWRRIDQCTDTMSSSHPAVASGL
ncbi:hypothetical protein LTR85_000960 [Meristemomyces frigidus]|nr:hypothetical protein LTR85_000960 [Meristemomyces frigidus]